MRKGRVYQKGDLVGKSEAIYLEEAGFVTKKNGKKHRLIKCLCCLEGCNNTFTAREDLLFLGYKKGVCEFHKGTKRIYHMGDSVGDNGAIYIKDIGKNSCGLRLIECKCANPDCDNHFVTLEDKVHNGFYKGYCENCRDYFSGLHGRKHREIGKPICDDIEAPIFLGYDESQSTLMGRFLCTRCNKNEFVRLLDDVEGAHHRWLCNECSRKQQTERYREKTGLLPGNIVNETTQVLWLEELPPVKEHERRGLFKNLITGIEFEASLSAVTTGNTSGIGCKSLGEYKVSQLLDEANIAYVEQYSFDDLRSPKNTLLRFDFYLPNDNILIEYDGIQHYNPNFSFGKTIEDWNYSKELDRLKNEYCEEHNIPLIRIPYWVLSKGNLTLDYLLQRIEEQKGEKR